MSSGTFIRRPAVLLVLALGSVGVVVTLLGRLSRGPQVEQRQAVLSNETGTEAYPAFSPDGRRLAYSGRFLAKDAAFHVFVRSLPSGAPRQLTSGSGNDTGPVWSPDGASIAFLRTEGGHGHCMVVPAAGGAERALADCRAGNETQPPPAVAWTRDGRALVVVQAGSGDAAPALSLWTAHTGSVRAVTSPPAGMEGASTPAVSPDGATLAFVRNAGPEAADLYLCDLTGGGLRRVTFDDRIIRGVAWMPDGRELVYGANRGAGWRLWRLPVSGGNPRELLIAGKQAQYPAIAAKGSRLAYTDSPSTSAVWLAPAGTSDATEGRPVIRSSGREFAPAWSPDGRSIADISDQSGAEEVWVSDAEGGSRRRLTEMKGPQLASPRWSPDGRSLLFGARGEHESEVYAVTVGGAAGSAHRVLAGASGASWTRDGRGIVYQSRGRIWKASADGSNPVALTAPGVGGGSPVPSADGKYVYYGYRRSIWRVPSGGGEAEESGLPDRNIMWTAIQASSQGVYYLEFDPEERGVAVSLFDLASRRSRVAFVLRNASIGPRMAFSVSPDGKSVLYPRTDQDTMTLMLVESFR